MYGSALTHALGTGSSTGVGDQADSGDDSAQPSERAWAQHRPPGAGVDRLMLSLMPSAIQSHRKAVVAAATASSPNSKLLRATPASRRMRAHAGSIAAHMGSQAYVARSKLKLRDGCELDSADAGELPASSIVTVLDQKQLPDGTWRAQLARYAGEPIGWVSCLGKDHLRNLVPFDWARFTREPRNPPPSPSPLALPSPPVKTESSVAMGAAPEVSVKPRKMRGAPSCLLRVNSMPGVYMSVVPGGAAAAAAEAPAPAAAAAASKEDLSPKSKREQNGSNASAKAARAAERFKTLSSEEMRETVTEFENEIAGEKKIHYDIANPVGGTINVLKHRIGAALVKSGVKIVELVKSWGTDSKGRNTGEISAIEFRKHVRKVLEWPNVKDIDGLFNELDSDGGKTLDTTELTTFMKGLRDHARELQAQMDEVQERIDHLSERLEFAQTVVQNTQEAEQAELMLKVELEKNPIPARIGKELLRKGSKIGDLVNIWESTEGWMDNKQFRKNVRSYGIDGDDNSIDEVFDSFDTVSRGSIDLETLRVGLTGLRDGSQDADKEAQRLKRLVEVSWKQAKASQLELRRLRKQDEADAKAKEEQAALEAEAAARAAVEAREAREARLLAKKQREEEEREAYEAKIAERRRKSIDKTK